MVTDRKVLFQLKLRVKLEKNQPRQRVRGHRKCGTSQMQDMENIDQLAGLENAEPEK